jgi:hypothetical protein
MPLPDVSPIAERLAARITGPLQSIARQYEPDFVQHAGGLLARGATKVVYPVVVREIPVATKIGCHKLLDELATMPMGDLASMVIQHAQATGVRAHQSFYDHFPY